jgi:hypothetical protein
MTKVKVLKVPAFIAKYIKEQEAAHAENIDLSAANIKHLYEAAYPNYPAKSIDSYKKALQRGGYTLEGRKALNTQLLNNQAQLDIEQYKEVRDYKANCNMGGVQISQRDGQIKNLRKVWELMNKTVPYGWTQTSLLEAIDKIYPKIQKENGSEGYKNPAAIKALLSPISTMFKGILQPNWSANLCVHKAGELKDYFRFHEMDLFLSKLCDTESLSVEGWQAIFRLGVNMGCREGTNGNTGILGLLWEDIDFQTYRCSLREKGHRGNAGERWEGVPLNMFKWMDGWTHLIAHWQQQNKPTKGKVFKISYNAYNEMFSRTLQKCGGRLAEVNAAMRLHTFNRRTHGQYCCRMGIPLEYICGKAPYGRFGVGWKDPKIPVNYYLSEESEEIDSEELYFMEQNMELYGDVLKSMRELNEKKKKWMGQ